MDMCTLHPPNSQVLSDDVIAGVVMRAKHIERSVVANIIHEDAPSTLKRRTWSAQNPEIFEDGTSPTDKKRRLLLKEGVSVDASAVMEQILSDQQRLREMRRARQIRYRKKKENYASMLEEETRELCAEIEKLKERRRSVSAAVPAKVNVWSVATEYFRLFRYGLKATTNSSSLNAPSVQQDFLNRVMTSDVVYNPGRGSASMAKNWKCLSLWFQDVELELEGMRKGVAGSLIATTTTSVTITDRTLRNVFPHLREGPLAKKLFNQRIVMRGVTRFEWDPAFMRVKSVFSQADMLTPLLKLLGSLEDVSCVFGNSLISPDFQWRLNSHPVPTK